MLGKLNLESTVLLKRRHTAKILTTGFPSINTQKKMDTREILCKQYVCGFQFVYACEFTLQNIIEETTISKENSKEQFSTFHLYFLNYTICLTFELIPHWLNTHKKSSNGRASTVQVKLQTLRQKQEENQNMQ